VTARPVFGSCLIAATLAIIAAFPAGVSAQGRDVTITPPTVELGGGIGWVGQADAGTRDATMTANTPGEAEPITFFRASGKTRSGAVGVGLVGINVWRRFGVEAGFQYSRPSLSVRVDEDVEDTPSLTVEGPSFDQYVTEGNFVYTFNDSRFDNRRTVPFVLAGVGVLRQKADDGTSETGTIYQAGLGFKWLSGMSEAGRANGLGMRLDVRYVFRDGGFDFEDQQYRAFFVFTATALFGL
jgi:hypothetical protein